jgi:hypothetical protein
MFWRSLEQRGKFAHNNKRNSRGAAQRKLARWEARLERLELRSMLSGVAFDSGTGTLTVTGTTGNDVIAIAPTSTKVNVQVTLNGQVISNSIPPVTIASINQINVVGDTGGDWLTVTSINKPVNFTDAGAGDELSVVGQPSANTFVLSSTTLTVNGAAYTLNAVPLLTVSGQNYSDSFTIQSLPTATVILHGSGAIDTLQGPDLPNTWNVNTVNGGVLDGTVQFDGMENLKGGFDTDAFNINATGSVGASIDGGLGADTLDYSNYGKAVTVNLQNTLATGVGRELNIETIVGGAPLDTVLGPLTATTWNFDGHNAALVGGIQFNSFENFTGSGAADSFVFADGAVINGAITGSGGADTFDLSAYTTNVGVNLETKTIAGIVTGSFSGIQSFTAPAATNNTFTGSNNNVTWHITDNNIGNVSGVSFTNFQNLSGGTKVDTFVLANGKGVTGTIDGKAGADVIDYSNYTGPITIDLSTGIVPGVGAIASINGYVGTPSNDDTLIGPNTTNTWTITSDNVGNVNGITFSRINNLQGSPEEDDTFLFAKGKKWDGKIDGGLDPTPDTQSFNTLDYSHYSTAVTVDLGVGKSTNVFKSAVGGVANITDVEGSSAGDTITGDGGDNFLEGNGGNDKIDGAGGNDIILGDAGNDTLLGHAGRDLLFGGVGKDTLDGGADEDILFSGTTSFDTDVNTISAIYSAWIATGPGNDFASRVASLRAGTNPNIGIPLDSTTVFNDTSNDLLTGGTEADWFFAKTSSPAKDTLADFVSGTDTTN